MEKCRHCGKELSKQQARNNKGYCSRECSDDSRYGEKVEWNGVWIRQGKTFEVLKLCGAGITPGQACRMIGVNYSAIRRLQKIAGAAGILFKRTCPVCGNNLHPALKSKYCSPKCRKTGYARGAAGKESKLRAQTIAVEEIKQRLKVYERQPKAAPKAIELKCRHCGKELSKQQVWNRKKYCSAKCASDVRFGEKVEWHGVWIRPGKAFEVLKLCCAGFAPAQACKIAGAGFGAIQRLKKIPGAAELLSKRKCPICGKAVPPPLSRKYCTEKCGKKAKYARDAAAKGINRRLVDYEGRRKTLELYQQGLDSGSIAQLVDVPKQRVDNWLYHYKAAKNFPPLRRQLEHAKTADEWAEILRNSAFEAGKSETVILVCAKLHGSGAPGRYIGIASEQFWHEDFYDGVCVAFCNILKNAVTTVEWRGDNFHLTRTFKTSGTFIWPDEKLGRSIEVTRAEFERLISLKKSKKSSKKHGIMSATIAFSRTL